jgi:protein ImuB
MKDPDITAQLPLPATKKRTAEEAKKRTAKKEAAKIVALPLPNPRVDGAIEDREASEASRPSETSGDGSTSAPHPKPRRQNLWYALYFPQLHELSDPKQIQVLNELAGLVESVSSTVSFHPQALICEIRSSLKYFGGIDSIHDKLKALLRPALEQRHLEDYFLYAATPTVSGSLLLARSGHNALVYQKDNLRSALGQLSTDVLQLGKEQNRRLYNMGIRKIRDIWRLPVDGLHKRFGSDFVNLLNKALGIAPEPTRNYVPPPAFGTAHDLPYEVENLDRLLPVVDEMLLQLCKFLRQRDLSTSHLVLSLIHEKRSRTEIDMGLRQPSRCRDHLLLLMETHFTNLIIPAPVVGLKLTVKQFDAFSSESNALLVEDRTSISDGGGMSNKNLSQFMEQLHARLGGDSLKSINTIAEHCPEYATQQLNYTDSKTNSPAAAVANNPRPFWLLDEPIQLALRSGKLYHRRTITLISGPERIESYWWSGRDIRRDYYIAREEGGSRLWIFRERSGQRHWYLHGYFS